MPETGNPPRVSQLMQRLAPGATGLESNTGASLESFASTLDPQTYLAASERNLRDRLQQHPNEVDPEAVERLLRDATLAIERMRGDGLGADLSAAMASGLEAVIETSGARPVLFIRDNHIDRDDPALLAEPAKTWRGLAVLYQDQIAALAPSVAAVVTPKSIVGTAFMVGEGLVLTNRHVVEHPFVVPHLRWNGNTGHFDGNVRLEFVGEKDATSSHAFVADELVFAGAQQISGYPLDFAKLDIALVRLKPAANFPPPLPLARSSATPAPPARPAQVQVIGFPLKPRIADGTGNGHAPPIAHEYAGILEKLFADEYGVKRWAPGEVRELPGTLDGDSSRWVLSHDASTLGGNSGSLIADFSDGGDVAVGIHFAGIPREMNWGHSLAAIRHMLPSGLNWA